MVALLFLALLQTQIPPPPSCSAPEYRQFDFWVGDWVVHGPKGQQLGTNRIEKIEGGCALQESWRSANGGTGRSINVYRNATKQWVQVWAGGGGTLLLQGEFDGKRMILQGESLSPNGSRPRNRITWSPLDGGKVRQVWERSTDEGKTWTVAFDGTYSRRAADGVMP
jgi:hypothetical protein